MHPHIAYTAVPITEEYLDVLERELGSTEFNKQKEEITLRLNSLSGIMYYLILGFYDAEGESYVFMPRDVFIQMFYTTVGERETLWAITK